MESLTPVIEKYRRLKNMDVLNIVNLAYFCWTDPSRASARDVNLEE
jgi:hypothetical protein